MYTAQREIAREREREREREIAREREGGGGGERSDGTTVDPVGCSHWLV